MLQRCPSAYDDTVRSICSKVHITELKGNIVADLFNGIRGSHKAVSISNAVCEGRQSHISFLLFGKMKLLQEKFIFRHNCQIHHAFQSPGQCKCLRLEDLPDAGLLIGDFSDKFSRLSESGRILPGFSLPDLNSVRVIIIRKNSQRDLVTSEFTEIHGSIDQTGRLCFIRSGTVLHTAAHIPAKACVIGNSSNRFIR